MEGQHTVAVVSEESQEMGFGFVFCTCPVDYPLFCCRVRHTEERALLMLLGTMKLYYTIFSCNRNLRPNLVNENKFW